MYAQHLACSPLAYPTPAAGFIAALLPFLLHSWKMNAGYLQSASMDQLTQLAKMTS